MFKLGTLSKNSLPWWCCRWKCFQKWLVLYSVSFILCCILYLILSCSVFLLIEHATSWIKQSLDS